MTLNIFEVFETHKDNFCQTLTKMVPACSDAITTDLTNLTSVTVRSLRALCRKTCGDCIGPKLREEQHTYACTDDDEGLVAAFKSDLNGLEPSCELLTEYCFSEEFASTCPKTCGLCTDCEDLLLRCSTIGPFTGCAPIKLQIAGHRVDFSFVAENCLASCNLCEEVQSTTAPTTEPLCLDNDMDILNSIFPLLDLTGKPPLSLHLTIWL